jgi:hypothetical protein
MRPGAVRRTIALCVVLLLDGTVIVLSLREARLAQQTDH